MGNGQAAVFNKLSNSFHPYRVSVILHNVHNESKENGVWRKLISSTPNKFRL